MDYKPVFFNLPHDNTLERTDKVEPYVFTEDIAIAIDVAHITGRPLLVEGKPGCGKSRLAEALAELKGWHYIDKSVTSRTTLEELTNDYDHLQRLHDAHSSDGKAMEGDWKYNRPGIFWWAFNRPSAKLKGKDDQRDVDSIGTPRDQPGNANHTVLLIDEIDKAEPDLPNDLLDILERKRIELTDSSHIKADSSSETFTIITSNRERALPAAFLRRCVYLYIEEPGARELKKIAKSHFGDDATDSLVKRLTNRLLKYRKDESENLRVPGTSEFIDALRVCIKRNITPDGSQLWKRIENSILRKRI